MRLGYLASGGVGGRGVGGSTRVVGNRGGCCIGAMDGGASVTGVDLVGVVGVGSGWCGGAAVGT